MTAIARVLAVTAFGAGYFEDQAALRASHVPMPERFTAKPTTAGFRAVRELAEAVSVGLVLDDGQVAWGDCVAVSYSGAFGRDEVFRAIEGLATIQSTVAPFLQGRKLTSFRTLAARIDALTESVEVTHPVHRPDPVRDGGISRRELLTAPSRLLQAAGGEDERQLERITVERPIHAAVRYGVSQALLQAVALDKGISMCQVIADEWDLPLPVNPVPIHAQSGSERYHNAEKMIVRRVASLPHALVDDVRNQVGPEGAELTRYARWLKGRISQLGGADYVPTIHLDVHGALGQIHNGSLGRVLGQLHALSIAVQPLLLRVESPIILASRDDQIEAMKTLRNYVRLRKMPVRLVADEWANTLEDIRAFIEADAADMIQIKMPDLGSVHNAVDAVQLCKMGGVDSLLGGSYAETDLSARVSVHVALATQPELLMAKPGVGVDEAISLTQNEMSRTLAWLHQPS